MSTTHAAGENGCSAADNPSAGTLNRSVTVQGGPSVTVYAKVQFTTTTPIGLSTTTVLEPLGAFGTVVDAPWWPPEFRCVSASPDRRHVREMPGPVTGPGIYLSRTDIDNGGRLVYRGEW